MLARVVPGRRGRAAVTERSRREADHTARRARRGAAGGRCRGRGRWDLVPPQLTPVAQQAWASAERPIALPRAVCAVTSVRSAAMHESGSPSAGHDWPCQVAAALRDAGDSGRSGSTRSDTGRAAVRALPSRAKHECLAVFLQPGHQLAADLQCRRAVGRRFLDRWQSQRQLPDSSQGDHADSVPLSRHDAM